MHSSPSCVNELFTVNISTGWMNTQCVQHKVCSVTDNNVRWLPIFFSADFFKWKRLPPVELYKALCVALKRGYRNTTTYLVASTPRNNRLFHRATYSLLKTQESWLTYLRTDVEIRRLTYYISTRHTDNVPTAACWPHTATKLNIYCHGNA